MASVVKYVELNFVITPFNEKIPLIESRTFLGYHNTCLLRSINGHRFIIVTINPFVLQDIIIPTDWDESNAVRKRRFIIGRKRHLSVVRRLTFYTACRLIQPKNSWPLQFRTNNACVATV